VNAQRIGDISRFPYVVVGSGFFGLTVAEQITSRLGIPVLILEKRDHIGGNAYSYFDAETDIEIHKYGSHLFHTSNETVWNYVNRFTSFNNYIHKVKITSKSKVYSMPINLHTINQFLGSDLSPIEARKWMETQTNTLRKESVYTDFESRAISLVGKMLYENFIVGYTQKQWQTDPKSLPAEIINRLPVRFNYDDRYFDDTYQGLPSEGYSKWFANMIKNPLISIATGIDFFEVRHELRGNQKIIYTGPIDRYFDYSQGHLEWRTLDLHVERVNTGDYQGTSVMNYADAEIPFTRIHEFKHLHPEREHTSEATMIMKEFSRKSLEEDEPFYPVNSESDRRILNSYRELQKKEKNVFFGGRLGRYQYLDMHMAIASALQLVDQLIRNSDEQVN
jgi:UDP-galactopyranose mutase